MAPSTYTRAIIGTIFSAKPAIRLMPPMKMKPASRMINRPDADVGTPKANENAVEMEFACTMLPIKPKATIISTEKIAAIGLLPRP